MGLDLCEDLISGPLDSYWPTIRPSTLLAASLCNLPPPQMRLLMLSSMLSIGSCHSKLASRHLAFISSRNSAACRVQPTRKRAYPKHVLIPRCTYSSMHNHANELTSNEVQMRKDATKMINAAIQAVNPYVAVHNRLRIDTSKGPSNLVVKTERNELLYNLSNYDNIKIYSFGKASAAMTLAAAEIASQSSAKLEGTCIIKDDHATPDEIAVLEGYNIQVRSASHPVPDSRSINAANEILQSASSADENTLIIVCISGGGSALFCSPREPLTLKDLMETNAALLKSGMPIDKMNVIRKRLDNGKGGKLAAAAYPGTVVTLILSDIIGDPLDLIASGPTVADRSSWGDAMEIVDEYGLNAGSEHVLPMEVLELLKTGCAGILEDTPKEDHAAFSMNDATLTRYSENVLVGNNQAAVMAAADEAQKLGYKPVVLGTRVEGEASHIAGVYVSMAEILAQQRDDRQAQYQMSKLPVALIAGGETTVTIPPDCTGKGGRNQELCLAAAIKMQEIGLRDAVLVSIGTDGTDGPTGK